MSPNSATLTIYSDDIRSTFFTVYQQLCIDMLPGKGGFNFSKSFYVYFCCVSVCLVVLFVVVVGVCFVLSLFFD